VGTGVNVDGPKNHEHVVSQFALLDRLHSAAADPACNLHPLHGKAILQAPILRLRRDESSKYDRWCREAFANMRKCGSGLV